MKVTISIVCACCLMAATGARSEPPTPVFIDPGPGLDLPYAANDAVANGYGVQVSSYGWHFTGWAAESLLGQSAISRYRPTLKDNTTWMAMPQDEDWIFRTTYHHLSGVYSSAELPVYLKYEWDDGFQDTGKTRLYGAAL